MSLPSELEKRKRIAEDLERGSHLLNEMYILCWRL